MDRFFVESNHNEADCHHAIDQFIIHGHILNFEWGCKAGVHSGWAIVEAEDECLALLSVPPLFRSKARAIRLCKFTPEMMQATHE